MKVTVKELLDKINNNYKPIFLDCDNNKCKLIYATLDEKYFSFEKRKVKFVKFKFQDIKTNDTYNFIERIYVEDTENTLKESFLNIIDLENTK